MNKLTPKAYDLVRSGKKRGWTNAKLCAELKKKLDITVDLRTVDRAVRRLDANAPGKPAARPAGAASSATAPADQPDNRLDALKRRAESLWSTLATSTLPARDVAALNREYRATLSEIDALEQPSEDDTALDDEAMDLDALLLKQVAQARRSGAVANEDEADEPEQAVG